MKNQLWSQELQDLTKSTLEDLLSGMFKGKMCQMKKKPGMYGYIKNVPGLMMETNPEIKIYSSKSDEEWVYNSIEDVIMSGWAVD